MMISQCPQFLIHGRLVFLFVSYGRQPHAILTAHSGHP